jgi:peroxiredoxin Q/BCP
MRGAVFVLVAVALMSAVNAESPEVALAEGDPAPSFEAISVSGEVWKSEEHIGKKFVVVYFYPADFTNGCTRQACGFRDHRQELEEADVEVVGISGDSLQTHELFARVNSLKFDLLADEDGKVAQAFGVPVREGDTITRMVEGVEQTLKRGVTASRWTFIIGKDGRIIRKNTMVDAEQDYRKVLETVRRLTADAE